MDPSARLRLLAAGSLQHVMTLIGEHWSRHSGIGIDAVFGPSGKLLQEIVGGRVVDVFASASFAHTESLHAQGLLSVSQVFAHNTLCVVSRPGLGLRQDNLLELLLQPEVRLATSTPGSDPMGDTTWQFFQQAERALPGSFARLDAKAIRYSGAAIPQAGSPSPYITAFVNDHADAYVMYATNAIIARTALPQLEVVHIPGHVNVRSAYGIGAASTIGRDFMHFVLAPEMQQLLREHGFQ